MSSQHELALICRALVATKPSVFDTERYQQWKATANEIARQLELYVRDFDVVRFNKACGLASRQVVSAH